MKNTPSLASKVVVKEANNSYYGKKSNEPPISQLKHPNSLMNHSSHPHSSNTRSPLSMIQSYASNSQSSLNTLATVASSSSGYNHSPMSIGSGSEVKILLKLIFKT